MPDELSDEEVLYWDTSEEVIMDNSWDEYSNVSEPLTNRILRSARNGLLLVGIPLVGGTALAGNDNQIVGALGWVWIVLTLSWACVALILEGKKIYDDRATKQTSTYEGEHW